MYANLTLCKYEILSPTPGVAFPGVVQVIFEVWTSLTVIELPVARTEVSVCVPVALPSALSIQDEREERPPATAFASATAFAFFAASPSGAVVPAVAPDAASPVPPSVANVKNTPNACETTFRSFL